MNVGDKYKKRGIEHQIIRKSGLVCIAKCTSHKPANFEVFKLNHNKGWSAGGRTFPESYTVARDAQWGTTGFTCQSIERAEFRFNQLCQKEN